MKKTDIQQEYLRAYNWIYIPKNNLNDIDVLQFFQNFTNYAKKYPNKIL